jgi:hypothetical protein
MKTAVASADDEGPKKKFGIGLPKKPSKGTYGLKPDKEKNDDDFGHFTREKAKPKKAYASAGDNPDKPKGPKLNNKMKVVPLKEKTIADQERQKTKAKEKLKGKGTNGKKKNGKK